MGALVAFVWIQWLLLSSRGLVMIAETARIRLQHMLEALRGKLAPWWKAAKEPVVQVLASFGILLSGVVGSVAMLVTGVVGVVDKALGVVGLGGLRKKILDGTGLGKVTDGIDKTLSGAGLGGIVGGGDGKEQGPNGGGMEAILQEFGVGSSEKTKGGALGGLSDLNPLGTGQGTTRKRTTGKKSK